MFQAPGCEMGLASLLSLEGTHHCIYRQQGWPCGAILRLKYLTWDKRKILRMKAKAKLAEHPGQSRQTTQSPLAGNLVLAKLGFKLLVLV